MTHTAALPVACLCLDVDGVLTDGRLYVDDLGRQSRSFNTQDGFALRSFDRLGGQIIWCSGKTSEAVAHRARELKIQHVIQGSDDKVADLTRLLDRLGLGFDQLSMIGDDLPELAVMRRCAWPIAVANAVDEVKAAARYVTTRPGGHGAVREALEFLLRPTGHWDQVLAAYR